MPFHDFHVTIVDWLVLILLGQYKRMLVMYQTVQLLLSLLPVPHSSLHLCLFLSTLPPSSFLPPLLLLFCLHSTHSSPPPLPSIFPSLFPLFLTYFLSSPPLLPPYQPHLRQRWLLRRALKQNTLNKAKYPQVRTYYLCIQYRYIYTTSIKYSTAYDNFTRPFLYTIASNKGLEPWKRGYLHLYVLLVHVTCNLRISAISRLLTHSEIVFQSRDCAANPEIV